MCISMPGRVIALEGPHAVVETRAGRRRASTLLHPDIAPGDLVAIAAGTIVDRLTETEAAELERLLRPALSRATSTNGGHHGPAH